MTRNNAPAVPTSLPVVTPGHSLREADVRQPAGHWAEDGDVVRCEVEDPAERDHADHRDKAAGNRLDRPREHDQDCQHRGGHERRLPRELADVPQREPELAHVAAQQSARVDGLRRDSEHPADLAHRHLNADAGQEADEDGAREEVGEEAEPGDPSDEEEGRCEQRAEARERDPLRRRGLEPRDAESRDPCVHDHGGRRIGADDEMPRRAEERERGDRDQDGVEAGDHRHPGELRVPHDLGDRERRERYARENVLREPVALVRTDALEHRDVATQAPRCQGGGCAAHLGAFGASVHKIDTRRASDGSFHPLWVNEWARRARRGCDRR